MFGQVGGGVINIGGGTPAMLYAAMTQGPREPGPLDLIHLLAGFQSTPDPRASPRPDEVYVRLDPSDVNTPSIRLAALMLDPTRSEAPETARMIDSASAL